ncbi:DUF3737 family protein [Enterococcus pallens]|uniref:Uncharacterized protein n=1 Tax=Enterococcus pallens ATCC BAA-351 TaxID=1158607 RepID=R2QFY4_9ENTE|nr:DUF3737 family protein [Enterococcus pallens]EOH94158.1 hypothetical protein UAU_01893 [Enterococcus pallens ATCC BAA-351]EOU24037.1 hypothetical protein I588_00024 [Enterococcus pallens ATCC BAA-351]
MKTIIDQEHLTGERALFKRNNLIVKNTVFEDGESPLKESSNLEIIDSIFRWKYPLWYCENVELSNTTLLETARSGIWYTNNISISDSMLEAPKTFRRAKDIQLTNVHMPKAEETFWNCENITLTNVQAEGNYFAMNSKNITATDFSLSGNYAFDGAENIEIHHSKLISKDAFWNCKDVTVYDSVIIGEYLGWNSKNLRFVNCYIESEQGLCYVENLVIENGRIVNTDLAFEYSTVNVTAFTSIDSVKNPISGSIKAKNIGELIMEKSEVNPEKTIICLTEACEKMTKLIEQNG